MNKSNFINKGSIKDATEFLKFIKNLGIINDDENLINEIKHSIMHLSGSKESRKETVKIRELEKRWYKSLEKKIPDYSIYNGISYLIETWVCWQVYSRKYLKSIFYGGYIKNDKLEKTIKINDYLGNIKSIADLGCGVGYTTAAFKEHFPQAKVYGTNVLGSIQWKICSELEKDCNFKLYPDTKNIGKVDMVFASEYFEHFEEPINHLEEIINDLDPTHLFFANTFTAASPGHFNEYLIDNQYINNKKVSRLFSKKLNELGYIRVKTSCWNSRPTYFKKK